MHICKILLYILSSDPCLALSIYNYFPFLDFLHIQYNKGFNVHVRLKQVFILTEKNVKMLGLLPPPERQQLSGLPDAAWTP